MRRPAALALFAGERGAKDAGRMRAEGKDCVVRDGGVMLFRFNA